MIIEETKIEPVRKRSNFAEFRRGMFNVSHRIRKYDIAHERKTINVSPGQNIQDAIEKINLLGGGIVFLKIGRHIVSYNITLKSGVYLHGETAEGSIIDFDTSANQIKISGDRTYSTGTISISNNFSTVTGSSTLWAANISTNDRILLGGQWYTISAIGSDTSLTLSVPYGGKTLVAGTTYIIANVIKDVQITDLIVRGSTLSAIRIQYANEIFFRGLDVQTSVIGMEGDDSSNILINECDFVANNSGFDFKNCHFITFNSAGTLDDLVGNGLTMNNVTNADLDSAFFLNSAGDGINFTACSIISCEGVIVTSAGGQGWEFVSGNKDIALIACGAEACGSDGFKMTGTTDTIRIIGSIVNDNAGYGINIAAVDCDDNIITECSFSGNTSGAINDSGVGTQITESNIGISNLFVKKHVRMKNTSGGSLVAGDLVTLKAVAAGDEVTTTTIQGDDLVFGMAIEAINNNSYGRIQILGKTTTLKVNGVTDIAVGDFIGTFTTAKIGMKAAVGDMAIAIALEAYITDDSNGVIDALLITPRKI